MLYRGTAQRHADIAMSSTTTRPAAADAAQNAKNAATKPAFAIVVAHGLPSNPEPLDASLAALAGKVSLLTHASGLTVRGATLAKRGALESALAEAPPGLPIRIYPFFMSEGYFTRKVLPRRVTATSAHNVTYLPPFGLDPELPGLCARRASAAFTQNGQNPADAVLVLAAHGSQTNPASAEATRSVANRIAAMAIFKEVRTGFVEEVPSISEAARGIGAAPAVCLPLFATSGGHVEDDIPEALATADFRGLLVHPIGEDSDIPALIAAALT
jgi:sirohydrochlorin ferrochelatase